MKVLKDPVYGYIKLDKAILDEVIDTPEFQRLRHIEQTSYTPLYSSALHNRFVHSIGVYHLGKLVSENLKSFISQDSSLSQIDINEINLICKDFELACLLHDVGHSPFSHSGEKFYYSQGGSKNEPIFNSLKENVNKDNFSSDFSFCFENKNLPKQHEIMSAIIGVSRFKKLMSDSEFFVRCITGIKYRDDDKVLEQIRNIFIQLLNSSCIDVDKIDYLLRDAYVTGFETVSIDYERLFSSLEIKEYKDKLHLVYNKRSLSVLENVIYAHDSERKWIQNHPAVLYESFLVQYSIKCVVKYYRNNAINLFSEKSLSNQGTTDLCKVRLLCDDDIIYIMKNELDNKLINEYFDRTIRRHPVWKSEAEYKVIFDNKKGKDWTKQFSEILSKVNTFLEKECPVPLLNQEALDFCEKEIERVKKSPTDSTLKKYDIEKFVNKYEELKIIIQKFKNLATAMNIDFDFVIVEADRFKTGFSKSDLQNMLIDFQDFKFPRELKSVTNLLDSLPPDEKKFYYLWYRRNLDSSISVANFSATIESEFNSMIQSM